VEVVADIGVDTKAVQAELDALRASLSHGADLGRFVAAVRALGTPLGACLPRSADDVNELPDAPVME
jgi:uncharacterized membrane protein